MGYKPMFVWEESHGLSNDQALKVAHDKKKDV